MLPPFVGVLELPDDVSHVDPPIDVHIEIELFGRMPQDECELPPHAVPLARTHDELAIRTAGRTQVVIREITVYCAFPYHGSGPSTLTQEPLGECPRLNIPGIVMAAPCDEPP